MPIVLTRATKQEARYKALGGREHCSACRFYMPQGTCGRIIGPVSPEGWCKFYSREFVQRWQPGSAGGNAAALPPGVSLDLSFMSPGTLPPNVVFTRASTATYTDASGTIQTAATNAPRWDYDPVTHQLRGLLIEEARTNVWLQSADASNAAWVPFGSISAAPVMTANQTIAPDGTMTAARAVYPAVSAANARSALYQLNSLTVAPYTFSVWLKGNAGGEQLYLMANDGGTGHYNLRVTLTTGWQRFVLTTNNLTVSGWYFMLGADLLDPGQTSTPAQTIFIWGGQLEQGAFPTSYIPTTAAAVTRAQDNATMPSASWFNQPASTVLIQYIAPVPTPGNDWETPVSIDDGSSNNRIQFYRVAGANNINANYTVAGTDTYTQGTGALTPGVVAKSAIAWRTGYQISALNGVASTANTLAAIPAAATTLRLGQASGGAFLDGYVQRFTYWPRGLSDVEMQQVTT